MIRKSRALEAALLFSEMPIQGFLSFIFQILLEIAGNKYVSNSFLRMIWSYKAGTGYNKYGCQ